MQNYLHQQRILNPPAKITSVSQVNILLSNELFRIATNNVNLARPSELQVLCINVTNKWMDAIICRKACRKEKFSILDWPRSGSHCGGLISRADQCCRVAYQVLVPSTVWVSTLQWVLSYSKSRLLQRICLAYKGNWTCIYKWRWSAKLLAAGQNLQQNVSVKTDDSLLCMKSNTLQFYENMGEWSRAHNFCRTPMWRFGE